MCSFSEIQWRMFGRNQAENTQMLHITLLIFAENFDICSVVQFNNDLVFAAGDDAAIRAWDHNTGQQKFTLSGHFSKVTALVLHEDTNQLLRWMMHFWLWKLMIAL